MSAADLTESEKQIKKFLLDPNHDVSSMTSVELGKQSYTSQASVMRLYKKLGMKTYREFISMINIERNEFFKIYNIDLECPSQYFTSYKAIQDIMIRLYEMTVVENNLLLDKNTITRVCNRLLNADYIDVYAIGIDDMIGKQLIFKMQSLGMKCTLHDTCNEQYLDNQDKNTVSIVISINRNGGYLQDVIATLMNHHVYTVTIAGKQKQSDIQKSHECILFYTPQSDDVDGLVDLFSAEYVINVIYAILKGKKDNRICKL